MSARPSIGGFVIKDQESIWNFIGIYMIVGNGVGWMRIIACAKEFELWVRFKIQNHCHGADNC